MQFVNNDEAVLLRTVGPGAVEQLNSVDDDDVRITLNGNQCDAFFKKLFITITMSFHFRHFINFDIYVPRSLCRLSFGHLSNCDGIQGNDASQPNDRKHLAIVYVQWNH